MFHALCAAPELTSRGVHIALLPESRHPKFPPFLVALGKLALENELKPALAADRYQVFVKCMICNPDLRSASLTPHPNRVISAKLAEQLGQMILRFFVFFFC
jgi:hypothetical protein